MSAFNDNHAFDPETLEMVVQVYKIVCAALPDMDKETIAEHIIFLAKQGLRDPVQIGTEAMQALKGNR
jgi:hypothetical protein